MYGWTIREVKRGECTSEKLEQNVGRPGVSQALPHLSWDLISENIGDFENIGAAFFKPGTRN